MLRALRLPNAYLDSLNLQALLKTAAARTGMDSPAVARARTVAIRAGAVCRAQSSHRKSAVCVVVVAGDEDVDRFCIDTRFFLAALEGASAAALEDAVKPFPSLQIDPYRNIAPHFGVASARAAALHAIANGTRPVVVASAAALLPRLSAPDNLEAAAIELRNGNGPRPCGAWRPACRRGFTREDPVDEHGEFCVRGGIVDYFPGRGRQSASGRVCRRDRSSRSAATTPSTQRSIETLDQAAVVPLTEKVRLGHVLRLSAVRSRPLASSWSKRRMRRRRPEARRADALSFEEARAENPKAPAPDDC